MAWSSTACGGRGDSAQSVRASSTPSEAPATSISTATRRTVIRGKARVMGASSLRLDDEAVELEHAQDGDAVLLEVLGHAAGVRRAGRSGQHPQPAHADRDQRGGGGGVAPGG